MEKLQGSVLTVAHSALGSLCREENADVQSPGRRQLSSLWSLGTDSSAWG